MTYNTGTATDYLDLLDQLVEVLTSRNLASIAINSGGTNYTAGEILDISGTGGTSTIDAQIEVVTVSAGVITEARIYRGGAYTVDPTTTSGNASTSTGFTYAGAATTPGTGATFDLTFAATGWTVLARNKEATGATVAGGGTGYSVSDVLTVVGGVVAQGGSAATFSVDSVSAGVITAVSLASAGEYEVPPTNPALCTVSPSGGSGATLTVSYTETTGDTTVVLQGTAGGSQSDPVIGIKTYSNQTDETGINTVYNFALFGATSWSSLAALHEQANISPGFATAADGTLTTTTTGNGAFVPLKSADAFDIEWSIRASGRSVVVVARIEGSSTVYYSTFAFGLRNNFAISSEEPLPIFVAGVSDRIKVWYKDTTAIFGGLTEAIRRGVGPHFVWTRDGEWVSAMSASISANTSTTPDYNVQNTGDRVQVWPLGYSTSPTTANDALFSTGQTNAFDATSLAATSGAIEIYRTPDTGGDKFPLYAATYVENNVPEGKLRALGEIDGVFWFHQGGSGAVSGDRIVDGLSRYTVFQNGTRVNPYSFFALLED